jgi:4-amino-4-deoxy-L-arabinose transferase-like glycosyltransferase
MLARLEDLLADVWTVLNARRRILSICSAYLLVTALLGTAYPQILDSAFYILYSRSIFTHQAVPILNPRFSYVAPALPLLAAASKWITGHFTVASSAMGTVAVYLTYGLIRRWYDERTAIATALVTAVNPFLVLWGGRLLVGTTILAGFLFVFILYVDFYRSRRSWYLYGAFVAGGLLRYVKVYGPIVLAIITAHYIITKEDSLKRTKELAIPLSLGTGISLSFEVLNVLVHGSVVPRVTGDKPRRNTELLEIVLPTVRELVMFSTQAFGLNPPNIVFEDLGSISPALVGIWMLLPAAFVGLLALGTRELRSQRRAFDVTTFVVLWAGSLLALYELQRVLGAGAAFLYRHFVTLTPLVSLLLVFAYRDLNVKPALKRGAAVLIAFALLVQMFAGATVFAVHVQTGWQPIVEWTEENVDSDEPIFTNRARDMQYRLPEKSFTGEVESAEWVILTGEVSKNDFIDSERIGDCVRHAESIDATKDIRIGGFEAGTAGRTWVIFGRSC